MTQSPPAQSCAKEIITALRNNPQGCFSVLPDDPEVPELVFYFFIMLYIGRPIIKINKALEYIRDKLDDREKQIIIMRYGLGNTRVYTQREVASILGISRSYVSRIEKTVLEKINKYDLKIKIYPDFLTANIFICAKTLLFTYDFKT